VRDPTTSAAAGETTLPKPDRGTPEAGPSRVGALRRPARNPGGYVRLAGRGESTAGSPVPATLSATAFATLVGTSDARGPSAVRSSPPVASVERVLIGSRAAVAEARIRIADGYGGTAEIQMAAVAGSRTIAAQILTGATGSRETLSDVMNEVRLRLRRRGIALTDARPDARRDGDGSRGRPGQDRGR